MKKLLAMMFVVIALATIGAQAPDVTGTWQGTLAAGGRELRIVIKISPGSGGALQAVMYSIDQSGQGLTANVTVQNGNVKLSMPAVNGNYDGKLSADGMTITGTWSQGGPAAPLVLTHATAETAWAIPQPPPQLAPMAADANPTFTVATIKPSQPGQQGKGITMRGRTVVTINTSPMDIATFAYGVHPKQIVGAPAWFESDRYDINGQPDGTGQPNDTQIRTMFEKFLADRFKLTFHREMRELPAYALVVGQNGSKLTKSSGDPNGLPGLGFRGLGRLSVFNATMTNFASLMQTSVLDRPVVDRTGLAGRWDFNLTWTPDESQFAGFGVSVPPPTNDPNAPPGLFTAIQEQLGLRFDSTRAPVDVLAVDKVEKPSEN